MRVNMPSDWVDEPSWLSQRLLLVASHMRMNKEGAFAAFCRYKKETTSHAGSVGTRGQLPYIPCGPAREQRAISARPIPKV